MNLRVTLTPEVERQLRERAAWSGQTVEAFVQQILEREVAVESGSRAKAEPTFDEVLAPIRKGFEESGMTEEELAALVEEVREEIWQEKQGLVARSESNPCVAPAGSTFDEPKPTEPGPSA